MEYIKMNIAGVYFEPQTNAPIVILREGDKGTKILPIWIGPMEASAILLQLKNISPPRPITHDLFIEFFKQNKMKVMKVVINDLKDNTFFATIYYKKLFFKKKIDARPSDAISIALRMNAPIYVKNTVIDKTFKSIVDSAANPSNKSEYYKKILEEFDNSELSKTIM